MIDDNVQPRIDADPGTEGFVGWAKAKLRELTRLRLDIGLEFMQRAWIVNNVTVRILTSAFGDHIRIEGGAGALLYAISPAELGFSLAPGMTSVVVPANVPEGDARNRAAVPRFILQDVAAVIADQSYFLGGIAYPVVGVRGGRISYLAGTVTNPGTTPSVLSSVIADSSSEVVGFTPMEVHPLVITSHATPTLSGVYGGRFFESEAIFYNNIFELQYVGLSNEPAPDPNVLVPFVEQSVSVLNLREGEWKGLNIVPHPSLTNFPTYAFDGPAHYISEDGHETEFNWFSSRSVPSGFFAWGSRAFVSVVHQQLTEVNSVGSGPGYVSTAKYANRITVHDIETGESVEVASGLTNLLGGSSYGFATGTAAVLRVGTDTLGTSIVAVVALMADIRTITIDAWGRFYDTLKLVINGTTVLTASSSPGTFFYAYLNRVDGPFPAFSGELPHAVMNSAGFWVMAANQIPPSSPGVFLDVSPRLFTSAGEAEVPAAWGAHQFVYLPAVDAGLPVWSLALEHLVDDDVPPFTTQSVRLSWAFAYKNKLVFELASAPAINYEFTRAAARMYQGRSGVSRTYVTGVVEGTDGAGSYKDISVTRWLAERTLIVAKIIIRTRGDVASPGETRLVSFTETSAYPFTSDDDVFVRGKFLFTSYAEVDRVAANPPADRTYDLLGEFTAIPLA